MWRLNLRWLVAYLQRFTNDILFLSSTMSNLHYSWLNLDKNYIYFEFHTLITSCYSTTTADWPILNVEFFVLFSFSSLNYCVCFLSLPLALRLLSLSFKVDRTWYQQWSMLTKKNKTSLLLTYRVFEKIVKEYIMTTIELINSKQQKEVHKNITEF